MEKQTSICLNTTLQTFMFEHYMDLSDPSVTEPILGTSLVAEISPVPRPDRRGGICASSKPGVIMEAGR